MPNTPNLDLVYLEEGQSRAEIIVNEGFNVLDQLAGFIIEATVSVPPASPSNGEAYVISSSPTGDFTGKGKNIALYYDGWLFIPPREGMTVQRKTGNGEPFRYDGANWIQSATVADLNQTISGTYTQSEVQAISDKVDELLAELRNGGVISS